MKQSSHAEVRGKLSTSQVDFLQATAAHGQMLYRCQRQARGSIELAGADAAAAGAGGAANGPAARQGSCCSCGWLCKQAGIWSCCQAPGHPAGALLAGDSAHEVLLQLLRSLWPQLSTPSACNWSPNMILHSLSFHKNGTKMAMLRLVILRQSTATIRIGAAISQYEMLAWQILHLLVCKLQCLTSETAW